MKAFQEQLTSLNISRKFHFVGADIVCLQKKSVYMLPFLVFHLIVIVVVMAVVFIGGFFVTMSSWELHLIPLIVVAVCVCVCVCVSIILKTVFLISSSFFNSLSDVE
jgi:hypothetical protein